MHRQEHVLDEVLQDYIEERLDSESSVRVQRHLAHCSRCRSEWEFWNRLKLRCQAAAADAVPEAIVQRALAIFDSVGRRPSLKERILAVLVFDSRSQPTPAGARDLRDSAFQLLYETPVAHVDLFCERDPSGWRLTGQVLCDEYPETAWRVDLVQETQHKSLAADALGEFHFLNLPDGDYELHVQGTDREIVLPTIHLA